MGRDEYLSQKLEKLVNSGIVLTANFELQSPDLIAKAVKEQQLERMPQFIYTAEGGLLGLNYVLAA
ncbi:MAG: hypothetical protein MJ107_03935 [Lachnospiraceae bacterium]|nr:hypothetical protein [Lachnospiraceae bacterium]